MKICPNCLKKRIFFSDKLYSYNIKTGKKYCCKKCEIKINIKNLQCYYVHPKVFTKGYEKFIFNLFTGTLNFKKVFHFKKNLGCGNEEHYYLTLGYLHIHFILKGYSLNEKCMIIKEKRKKLIFLGIRFYGMKIFSYNGWEKYFKKHSYKEDWLESAKRLPKII